MKWGFATYFILLTYIIFAIIFWGISLQRQSNLITVYEIEMLKTKKNTLGLLIDYDKELKQILKRKSNRTLQYVGEGVVFIIITFYAGYTLYKSFQKRKKFKELQNNFMLSVTHELKSPIAGVKLNLQTLQRHQSLSEDKKQILIQRTLSEADRLNNLCNNLLLASQIEGNRTAFKKEKIDLAAVCNECIDDYQNRSTHTLIKNYDHSIFIEGDLLMWKIAINNLLENAIKYSPKESPITISITQDDENTSLSVQDFGVGIPQEEKSKIFNKFYRIGQENSRTTKGTGLGLFLTAEIVKHHESSIIVKDNVPNGSIFEIIIPHSSSTIQQ